MQFNPGTVKRCLKYEYPFLGKGETNMRNFLLAEDPYTASTQEKLKSLWIEESKILHGSFYPSGPQKPIQVVSKSKMKDIVDYLKKLLLSDWNDVNFVIGTNPNDLIEIKFDVETTDTAHGLNAYLNTLMSQNTVISGFQLRKVTQYWPYQSGKYIYYMIAPPWKKLYVVSLIDASSPITLPALDRTTQSTRAGPTGLPMDQPCLNRRSRRTQRCPNSTAATSTSTEESLTL